MTTGVGGGDISTRPQSQLLLFYIQGQPQGGRGENRVITLPLQPGVIKDWGREELDGLYLSL